ncbi:hypothetical protein KUV26_17975 [Leisingera daeponensis]|uniref:MobA/VirD2-like nuclease domain-containing protein n=1 Tax=Leisingera daeponensis TaxID=405746 RepID=A0ABS7NJF8_9RHOB|nr:hypothetical protein [Leisingera daeponensis]MBY6141330.1 hypothetical protein [Leisingera daeponensis]
MRAIVKHHRSAEVVEHYIFRDRAELIGGTIPSLPRTQLRRKLDRMSGGHGILHMTLSLPKGLRGTVRQWLRIIMTALTGIGLPPYATPWISARHTNTECDHVHIAIISRSFTGRILRPRLSRLNSDRAHQNLAQHLGLVSPVYFDPSVPRLVPPAPRRRLTSNLHRQLISDLQAVFQRHQPRSIKELGSAMRNASGGFRLTVTRNNYGVESYL